MFFLSFRESSRRKEVKDFGPKTKTEGPRFFLIFVVTCVSLI